MSDVRELAVEAKTAAARLATLTTEKKNDALLAMADGLENGTARILAANARDLDSAHGQGLTAALMDRLALDEDRVREMADGLRDVVAMRDPVGEVIDGWRLPNGLTVERVRVPLGVIGVIYEARPGVTVDAAGLCLKSGNAVLLRGSSSAVNSNTVLVGILAEAAARSSFPGGCVQLIGATDREAALEMMKLHGLIDVLIPRGGEGLIRSVVENSTVPVIETGVGNCHIYVDRGAEIEMAVGILVNAKTQRPGVCNAAESLLVHVGIAGEFLPAAMAALREKGVVVRGDGRTCELLPDAQEAVEEDWYAEYLDLILAVRVVDGLEEAIEHINRYGSGHSDAIVTSDYERGRRFTEAVDSAAVYVNASTRFTDGGEFGMGAEIGISTQKLHARGPMGLSELTSSKYVIRGSGQTRA